MNLFHVTNAANVEEIIKFGLQPSRTSGLMHNQDGLIYLTDSLEYIQIMAEDIAGWKEYAIFEADVDEAELTLVWWEGKGHKEWTAKNPIAPNRIYLKGSYTGNGKKMKGGENMSYSFNNPCFNCKKLAGQNPDGECKDAEKIREAIASIHMSNDGTHKGSGEILLMCTKVEPVHN